MDDKGLSNKKKYFLTKLLEDIKILYKRFNIFFLIILIYKLYIKIPGIFINKKEKIHDENLNAEINKLI